MLPIHTSGLLITCRYEMLIPVDHMKGPANRYIHQRLQQCPEQERLIAMAQKLAVAQKKPVSSIRPLEARPVPKTCPQVPGVSSLDGGHRVEHLASCTAATSQTASKRASTLAMQCPRQMQCPMATVQDGHGRVPAGSSYSILLKPLLMCCIKLAGRISP